MKNIIVIGLIILPVILSSCNKDNPLPPGEQPKLYLTLEDISCTEAWIKLSTNNISLPTEVDLYKDSSLSETINLTTADTVLYVDSLLPNKSYSYQSVIQSINQSSNSINVTTMDTTSHSFTWQTYTFGGQAGTCSLYDVAIINENDIWAVGEIYLLDTLGVPDPIVYNAVHWNGSEWKIKRVQTLFNGSLITIPLEGIFAFSSIDIWVVGSLPIHGDGENWVIYDLRSWVDPSLSLSKAWGSNTNNMYFVGRTGSIAHYLNGHWSRIESGTNANIGDIWGIPDENGGYNKYLAADNSMLKIDKNDGLTGINGESGMIFLSVWGNSNHLIYTAGSGVVLYRNNMWYKIENPEINSIYRITGEELNEIYGISSPGNIIKYFNGISWYTINTQVDNRFWDIKSGGNEIAAVGYRGESAIVTILIKN